MGEQTPQQQLEAAAVKAVDAGLTKFQSFLTTKFGATNAQLIVTLAVGIVVTGIALLSSPAPVAVPATTPPPTA